MPLARYPLLSLRRLSPLATQLYFFHSTRLSAALSPSFIRLMSSASSSVVKGSWTNLVTKGEIPQGRSSNAVSTNTPTEPSSTFRSLLCPHPFLLPPAVFSSSQSGVIGDVFYTFSGENTPRVPINNDVYALDLNTHHWRRIPAPTPSPNARVGHAAAVLNSLLYVYAGRVGAEFADTTLGDLWAFDPTSSTWTEIRPAPSSPSPPLLSYHTLTASPTHLYLFGGCTIAHGRSNALWSFHPATATWEELSPDASPSAPQQCGGSTAVCVDDTVHVLFGYNGKVELDHHSAFHLPTRQWSPIHATGHLPTPRSVTDAVYLPGLRGIWTWGGEYTPSAQGHDGAGSYHGGQGLVYEVAGKEWRLAEGEGPSARGWFNTCPGPDGKSVVVFGGFDGNGRINDTWMWTAA